jgi:spore coat protein SA
MIYHLLNELENFSERIGGAISRWAANVLKTGEEVVVCPDADSSWGFPAERVYCLPNWGRIAPLHPLMYRLPWPLQQKAYLLALKPLLERVRPGDVIYVHNAPESVSVLATVADRLGIKVVLHMHNSHLTRASKGQLAALKDWPIVFCSEFLRQEVVRAFPGHFRKTEVVYNGADDSKFHGIGRTPNPVPNIIFTGRLVPYKGVHVLVKALRILETKGVAAECKIVGRAFFANDRSTRYTRELEKIRAGNTEMVGYRSGKDLAAMLRNADIFCCPSIWNDPFPLAPLEAMATGLPVVASNTGGLPEALAYGGGVLVPPDSPEALAAALEDLIVNPKHRTELSAAASEAFRRNFLWSSVRRQYETALRSFFPQEVILKESVPTLQ